MVTRTLSNRQSALSTDFSVGYYPVQEYLVEYLIQNGFSEVHVGCTPGKTLTTYLFNHVTKKWVDERRGNWTKIRRLVALNLDGWAELVRISRVEVTNDVIKLHKKWKL